ncbi:MAG: S1C family serine protease [Phycisphaerales bacterium]
MPGRRRRISRTITAAAIAALALSAQATAQDADGAQPPAAAAAALPTVPPVESLVADLGSPNIGKRLIAFELARSGRYPLRQLEEALRRDDLTLEQRRRLVSAARARFESEPRAAMGIQFDMAAPDTRGALIGEARPGFHARDVLRARDRIVKADRIVIDRRDTLRKIIVSHDPGDEVPLVLEREGATLETVVRLGDFQRLSQPMDLDMLRKAWDHRSQTYAAPAGAGAAPIESGLTGAAWAPAEESEEDAELIGQFPAQRGRMLDPASERTGVVAGGEARHGLGSDLRHIRTVDAAVRGGPMLAPMIEPIPANVDLQTLRALRDNYALTHARLQEQLNRPGVRRRSAQVVQTEVERLRRQIMLYDAEIQRRSAQRPAPAPQIAPTPPPR